MNTFREASYYIKTTSAENIAKRTAIIGAYYNFYRHTNFGHDYILDIIAALYGPFDFDTIHDRDILDMLDYIEYGFNENWPALLMKWGEKYLNKTYVNKELLTLERSAFVEMWNTLNNGKGDAILREYNYICQVIRPHEYEYFPEMNAMACLNHGVKIWERI